MEKQETVKTQANETLKETRRVQTQSWEVL